MSTMIKIQKLAALAILTGAMGDVLPGLWAPAFALAAGAWAFCILISPSED